MTTYVIRRILGLFPVLFGVTLSVFFLIRLIPGDPAIVILGERANAEDVTRLREQLGLNKPLLTQYLDFMMQLLRGDLGSSIVHKTRVNFDLSLRFPATIEMIILAMIIGVSVGITIGVISAINRNSVFDIVSMIGAYLGVSMPIFWWALILIYKFSVNNKIFPPSGRLDAAILLERRTGFVLLDTLLAGNLYAFGNALWHLILPSLVLSLTIMPLLARITRACMLDVLSQDYIRAAHAKGLKVQVVIIKHGLRNALLPVITVAGGQLGSLLGGAILTETVFSWPGMGTWTYQAILERDYPVVQASVLVNATIYVLVNLTVDLLYTVLDPRIRYS